MNEMKSLLQVNVPKCPKCSAMMIIRVQRDHLYHICKDCKAIYEISGDGQADGEVEINIKD